MSRTISDYEMERRRLMAKARMAVDDAIAKVTEEHELTVSEWLQVLSEIQGRMIGLALVEEWSEEPKGA